MKKVIFILLTVLLFCTIKSSAQQNQNDIIHIPPYTLDVDGIFIKVPTPTKQYKWDNLTLKKFYKSFIPDACIIQNTIEDSSDYNLILQNEFDKLKLERFMVAGYKDIYAKKAWDTKNFNKFMHSKTDTLIYTIDKIIDSVNFFKAIKKSKIKLNKFNFVKNLCRVYAIDSAFGVLSYELRGNEKSSYIKLCVTNYMKIKNKTIITMVFANYNSKEDIIWLNETSENWTKIIFEANKSK